MNVFACVTLREPGEPWQFVLTRLAPGGPEVQNNDLTVARRKLLCLAMQILERELRRGVGALNGGEHREHAEDEDFLHTNH
jgi:hypothetical protein